MALTLNIPIVNNTTMKTFFDSRNLKPLSLAFACILFTAALFTSCSKDNSNMNIQAFIKVTNAADGSASQDFYLDNKKATTDALAYGQSMGFFATSGGMRQADFRNTGSSTVNTSFSLTLGSAFYYDIFYVDGNSYTVFQDDRTIPQSGKTRVRFINLSSALTSNIDVATSLGGKFISGLAYKAASGYADFDPTEPFLVYASGSATALINIPAGTLQAGHIYTVYVSGSTSADVAYNVITES
jgi:hypothetical protein